MSEMDEDYEHQRGTKKDAALMREAKQDLMVNILLQDDTAKPWFQFDEKEHPSLKEKPENRIQIYPEYIENEKTGVIRIETRIQVNRITRIKHEKNTEENFRKHVIHPACVQAIIENTWGFNREYIATKLFVPSIERWVARVGETHMDLDKRLAQREKIVTAAKASLKRLTGQPYFLEEKLDSLLL